MAKWHGHKNFDTEGWLSGSILLMPALVIYMLTASAVEILLNSMSIMDVSETQVTNGWMQNAKQCTGSHCSCLNI